MRNTKGVINMIRKQQHYMTLEDVVIEMTQNGSTVTNPFSGFDIFNVANTGYQLTGDILWMHFFDKYKLRLVGRPVPPLNKTYVNTLTPTITLGTVATEAERIEYVYKFVRHQLGCFLRENRDNYWRRIKALTEDYNPLENYNMLEMSGSVSKVSDTQSTPGTVTTDASVYPYNANTKGSGYKPESRTETSATKSTAGYVDSNKSMRWASGDDFGETPQGNSVAMNKHTRSGNIGVTTSQQMLEQEMKIRLDSVVDEFLAKAADTCLLAMWK